MPELPEVETVRRGLAPVLVGNTFRSVEQRRGDLRFPLPKHFAERLRGRKVGALDRRAKYLLAHLADGTVVRYSDTRRFGLMDLIDRDALPKHALFRGLGVEPLSQEFTPKWL